ncbi:MAG: nuclear transport factor 2 family protein [Woeseiaceae bacterium]|nr:nuclear transport factor 2 family protein [Woeseiaceae bacterium]
MTSRQEAKAVALEYMRAAESAQPEALTQIIEQYSGPDYSFRGVHPFNELEGAAAVAETVWMPLRRALTPMQRRQDIFFAGPNLLDNTMWVTSMGQFMGLFDRDWLGIPSTGKIAFVPYCEFFRIEDGRIAESALWVDIISVMHQAGIRPLPMQTGAEIVNPGPRTSDGVLLEPQDEAESKKTLDLIMQMCADLVGDTLESASDTLRKTWHEDMIWFGPAGIGATYTIERYQQQHQGPFRAGLEDIDFHGHVLEHAEGDYGSWFGWPNLRMKQGRGFLGLPESTTPTEMRVVDVYRRRGDKLAENWIFIDFLHYKRLLGVDVLERCRSISQRRG